MDPEAAIEILRAGQPISSATVEGTLVLRDLANATPWVIRSRLSIVDSILDEVDGGFITVEAPITLERVTVHGRFQLLSTFFVEGFSAVDCRFERTVEMRWGGHNQNGAAFRLERCQFDEFVDFEDEWFRGPVEIRGCTFHGGTNLLGNQGQPNVVSFDVPPVIEFNTGRLDLDGTLGAA